jgi:hypothetical protein
MAIHFYIQYLAASFMLSVQSSIQSLNDFHKLCEERTLADNSQFGINSIYLPNPIFTLKPKYCLVAMEPSLGGMSVEIFQSLINQGFKNFLYSAGDFILHYCAYNFLCNCSFDYQISDLSKGAMKTSIATSERNRRYENWLYILKQELEFFGNPYLIAVGRTVEDFLISRGFEVECYVMHYSGQNSVRFTDYYNQHSEKFLADNLHIKLKEFATKTFQMLDYPPKLQAQILGRLFNNELTSSRKGMYLYYMDKFSETAANKLLGARRKQLVS